MNLTSVKKEVGIQVKKARKKKKWSQETLSISAGTNRETIRTIENGTANWTIEKLVNICSKLGMKSIVIK